MKSAKNARLILKTMRSSTPREKAEERDAKIAKILTDAWAEYAQFFGEPLHGTFKQFHAMLALKSAGKRIEGLFKGKRNAA